MAKESMSDAVGELYEALVSNGVVDILDKGFADNASYHKLKRNGLKAKANNYRKTAAFGTRVTKAEHYFGRMFDITSEEARKTYAIVQSAAADAVNQIISKLIPGLPKSPEDKFPEIKIEFGVMGGHSPRGDFDLKIFEKGQENPIVSQILELKMYNDLTSGVKYYSPEDSTLFGANTFWNHIVLSDGQNPDFWNLGINGLTWEKELKEKAWASYFNNILNIHGNKNAFALYMFIKNKDTRSKGNKTIIRGYSTGESGASMVFSMEAMMKQLETESMTMTNHLQNSTFSGVLKDGSRLNFLSVHANLGYLKSAREKNYTKDSKMRTKLNIEMPAEYFNYAHQKLN